MLFRPPTRIGRGGGRRRAGPGTRAVLLRLLGMATVAGLVVAALLLPAVGGIALFSKDSADHFVALPDDLAAPPLAADSQILASDGSVLATLHGAQDRTTVPIKQVPVIMQRAIVAIEDSRFYSHGGVDLKGLARAALRNGSAGSVQQGGSTITQQYVKNVLLDRATTDAQREAAAGDSLDRKVQEVRYAVQLERVLTKQQILERYLNIAYFGEGAYGIGTAATRYFSVPVSRLTLPQAALLAGLVQSPSSYDPVTHPDEAKQRRDTVLDRMAELKVVTAAQAAAAKKAPLGIRRTSPPTADSCEQSRAPFFCDYVRTQLEQDPALGDTVAARERVITEGGLVIRTTLDPKVQTAAQLAVDATVPSTSRVAAAEVVLQPGTGNVLAMAVNKRFGSGPTETKLPLPTSATFQPGSTFKVFTVAAALTQGYGLNTRFYAPNCYVSPLYNPQAGPAGTTSGRAQGDCANGFTNAEPGDAGLYDLRTATAQSVNTYFIQLEEKVGVSNVAAMATRLGIPAARLTGIGPNDGSLTIGTRVVSPMDMATAYATLAAHGKRCTPRFLSVVTDSARRPVAGLVTPPACQQVLPATIADATTDILTSVITSGTGRTNAQIGRPAAGKTGTTENFGSAWFVGYTPQLAAAVELGDPRGPQAYPLRDVTADGQTYAEVFGGDLPAIVWGRTMTAALDGVPVIPFAPPDSAVEDGTQVVGPQPGSTASGPPSASPSPGGSGSPTPGPTASTAPTTTGTTTTPGTTSPTPDPVQTWPGWVPIIGGQPVN